jgi:hypothetical protein
MYTRVCVTRKANVGMKMYLKNTHLFHLQVAYCSCFLEQSVAQEHCQQVFVAEYHLLLWI